MERSGTECSRPNNQRAGRRQAGRLAVLAAGLLVAVGTASCAGSDDGGLLVEAPPAEQVEAAPSQDPEPADLTTRALTSPDLQETSLAVLAPEAAEFLQTREGRVGVAVVVPSHGVTYVWNGHEKFHMASVVKVLIMLTVMQQALDADRGLTEEEIGYLRPMITVSDNDTASLLWSQVGGGEAVEAYVRGIGLFEIEPNRESCWGASYASAYDAALLFAMLALGEVLDDSMRAVAIGLLQEVDPAQTWGVTAAAAGERAEGTVVGVKDGWYPAGCGWWVNSVGFVMPADEKPSYAIAVLTSQQETWDYGIQTIETIGAIIYERLHQE
jgi:hypothetical protein